MKISRFHKNNWTLCSAKEKNIFYEARHNPASRDRKSNGKRFMHHCVGLCSCHAMLALSNNYFFLCLFHQQRLKMTIHIIYLPPTNVSKMKSRNSIKNLSKKNSLSVYYIAAFISSSLQLQKFLHFFFLYSIFSQFYLKIAEVNKLKNELI